MRYWVYQDSRILGPFAREDLAALPGLGPASLVCPEGAGGVRESDWRSLDSVEELASFLLSKGGVALGAVAEASGSEEAFDSFREKAHAALEGAGYSGEWVSGVWDDSGLFPSVDWMEPGYVSDPRLEAEKSRSSDLEARLLQLKEELEHYRLKQDEILERLNEKDRLLEERERELSELRLRGGEPVRSAQEAPPILDSAPPAAILPEPVVSLPEAAFVPPIIAEEPAPASPAAVSPEIFDQEAPHTVGEYLAAAELGKSIPEPTPLKGASKLPGSMEFTPPVPKPAFEPAAPPPVSVEALLQAAPEPAPLPPEPAPPPPEPASPLLEALPPEPTAARDFQQPKTMVYGGESGQAALAPEAGFPPSMDSAPEDGGPQTLTPLPLTDPAGSPAPPIQTDLPASVMQGLGLRTPASQPLSSGEAPASALSDTATGAPLGTKSRPRQKGFLIALGVSLLCLVAIVVLFLRNPKQVVQMVNMDPARKPAGTSPPAGIPQGAPTAPKSVFPGRDSAPGPQEGSPAPAASPAAQPAYPSSSPARDYIEDHRLKALQFVKEYNLGRERGTIDQWLQYSFESSGNKGSWNAGALEANVYVVTYCVGKGDCTARGARPLATYRFEADLNRGTVVGVNPEAKDLLVGSAPQQEPPAARAKARAAASPRAKPKRAVKRAARKRVPAGPPSQLPLPEEEEMDRSDSAAKAAQFNNPGSEPLALDP